MLKDQHRCNQCGAALEPVDNRVHTLCERCQGGITVDLRASTTPALDDPTIVPSGGVPLAKPAAVHFGGTSGAHGEFGDYELLHEIARGGMGVVYKARHKKLNRVSALKMILAGRFSSEDDVQRFYVEAAAAAQLDHPGIIPVYEISSHEGHPYFSMKYVEGGSLAEHRERIRKSPENAASFVAKIARAVHHAHQRGILHRDLKPANILLDADDAPLITDLGLATSTAGDSNLTRTGAVIGTPSYMPPEQAHPTQSLTMAADIYSIGAILYELLTGRPPFQGKTPMETVLQVLQKPLTPPREIDPEVDRDLELICLKCLEREPESRYESAADLAQDLENWVAHEPISVHPPTLLTRARGWIRRNRGIGYAVFALLTAFVFAFPVVLSLLGSLENPAGLYENSESDPTPWIYSFTRIPNWLSVASGVFMLCLWPSLGPLVILFAHPPNYRSAATSGGLVAFACAGLFTLLLGWVPFMLAAQLTSNSEIHLLAKHVWPDEGQEVDEIEAKLLETFPKLAEIPIEERVDYLANRVFADGVANGPRVWFTIVVVALFIGIPILVGTLIARSVFSRGQPLWLSLPRYYAAWFAVLGTVAVWPTAFFGGRVNVNGQPFVSLPWYSQILFLAMFPTAAFLILRKWNRTKSVPK